MKKHFGIRARFIFILVLVTLIPLLITGYILTNINEESIKVQTKEFQLSVSVQLTELTHSILNNSCSELNEISRILSDTELSTDQVIRLTSYKVSNSKNIQSVNFRDQTLEWHRNIYLPHPLLMSNSLNLKHPDPSNE